jgi:methyltransferase
MILTWPLWAQIVMGYVVILRLAELIYARRNTKALLSEGGKELGASHYPIMVGMHALWLAEIIWIAQPDADPNPALLAVFFLSQLFRFWTLASIGRWWTTRIISAPHFPRITAGPYKYLRHPNYTVVIIEIALIPMLLGAQWVAFCFTILNAAMLWWRISIEEQALKERRDS